MKTPTRTFGEFFMLIETAYPDCTVFRETASNDLASVSMAVLAGEICDGTIDQPIVRILAIYPKLGVVNDKTREMAKEVEAALWALYQTRTTADYIPQIAIDFVNKFRKTDILEEIRWHELDEDRDRLEYERDRHPLQSELI